MCACVLQCGGFNGNGGCSLTLYNIYMWQVRIQDFCKVGVEILPTPYIRSHVSEDNFGQKIGGGGWGRA